MQRLILKAHKLLIKKGRTLAVAESCTGGLLSKLLTDIPGSSRYFLFGAITYSNKAKVIVLKIPRKLLLVKGAVSREVAREMSHSARQIAAADFGIGITGIAGPAGSTPEKPVGTVFIAVDSKDKRICEEFHFKGSRQQVRNQAALKSLEMLIAIA